MSVSAPPARIDTSRITSPRDPMTPEEREAVRQELREGLGLVARYVEAHGDPWQGLRPDWMRFEDDALDDHAA